MSNDIQGLPQDTKEIIMSIVSQTNENTYKSRDRLLKDLNAIAQPGGIVFVGDSITEGFPIHELLPQRLSVKNRGVGGITSAQLLKNIDHYATVLKPEKVILLVGTNDFNHGEKPKAIAERVSQICAHISLTCPQTRIYVQSVYPLNNAKIVYRLSPEERSNNDVVELNRQIKLLTASIPNVKYIDMYSQLADAQGDLKEEYTTDGIHISVEGYQKISEVLLPYIQE